MAVGWVLQQLGPRFRSNNAGDGPEKTRDRKFWFPRFKSTLLGSYRSKATYVLCECALPAAAQSSSPPASPPPSSGHRSKTTNGNHCACGRDEWHMAKKVEEKEYALRLEVSKQYGGMRYDDAVAQHNADVDRFMAHLVPQLPCKFFAGGCNLCDSDTSRRVAQRCPPSPFKSTHPSGSAFVRDVEMLKTEHDHKPHDDDDDYDDMAPLPLHIDHRAAHWKDPTLVHEYLGCFLETDVVKSEFYAPTTPMMMAAAPHYPLHGRSLPSTAMHQFQIYASPSPVNCKVEPPVHYDYYNYT